MYAFLILIRPTWDFFFTYCFEDIIYYREFHIFYRIIWTSDKSFWAYFQILPRIFICYSSEYSSEYFSVRFQELIEDSFRQNGHLIFPFSLHLEGTGPGSLKLMDRRGILLPAVVTSPTRPSSSNAGDFREKGIYLKKMRFNFPNEVLDFIPRNWYKVLYWVVRNSVSFGGIGYNFHMQTRFKRN